MRRPQHTGICTQRFDPERVFAFSTKVIARVTDVRDEGPDRVLVGLTLGDGNVALLARITRRSMGTLGLRAGLTVYAQIKGVALFA
ncbi:MAG: TOBE domain-containing protein [Polyangiaceae bacterium]